MSRNNCQKLQLKDFFVVWSCSRLRVVNAKVNWMGNKKNIYFAWQQTFSSRYEIKHEWDRNETIKCTIFHRKTVASIDVSLFCDRLQVTEDACDFFKRPFTRDGFSCFAVSVFFTVLVVAHTYYLQYIVCSPITFWTDTAFFYIRFCH